MEEKVKNNYVLGVLGALIGAFVGSIPWILMYVYGNMMYSLLAILIVLCGYYGYKITKAKIDRKLPVILSITSFVAITVTMFLIIPICLMMKEGLTVSLESIQALYQYDEFFGAIIGDYVIALLFCVLVISGIIVNLNKQLKEGVDAKDIKLMSQDLGNQVVSNEDIEKVKGIFDRNNALDKHSAVSKDTIMQDLEKEFGEEKAKKVFDYLKAQQVIKKKSGNYYFSEKAQKSSLYRYGLSGIKIFIIVMVIAVIIAGAIILANLNSSNNDHLPIDNNQTQRSDVYELGVGNLKFQSPENMIILTKEEAEYYFGEDIANLYNCLMVSDDFETMLMGLIQEKVDELANYDAKGYLESVIDNDSVEIKEQSIEGNTFYYAEESYKSTNGSEYNTMACVGEVDNKFICILLDYPKGNSINLADFIKK